ncbi:hypothetical protein G7046_g8501 [Stylonectria norvegica]|nr:hypothetical protein G7046_g8501 [Stylonectria norvegica]
MARLGPGHGRELGAQRTEDDAATAQMVDGRAGDASQTDMITPSWIAGFAVWSLASGVWDSIGRAARGRGDCLDSATTAMMHSASGASTMILASSSSSSSLVFAFAWCRDKGTSLGTEWQWQWQWTGWMDAPALRLAPGSTALFFCVQLEGS